MLQFRQIKERSHKDLSRLFPNITIRPFIKKSTILQSIFKVIPCPAISPSIFKSSIESLNSPTHQSICSLHETLKQTEQYFTACVNILEHNERVRQKYEALLSEEDRDKQLQIRELKDLIRTAGTVVSKSEFVEFTEKKGHIAMGCEDRTKDKDNVSKSKMGTSNVNVISKAVQSLSQLKQLYLPLHPDQYSFITVIQQDQYLRYHEQTLQKLLIELTTINKLNRQLAQFISQAQKPLPVLLRQSLKQILAELSVEEMLRVQDNKYSQVIKYLLGTVYEASRTIEKRKQSIEYHKTELKDALLRMFYLQFMVRKQLEMMKNSATEYINTNKSLLETINKSGGEIAKESTDQKEQRLSVIKKINPNQLNSQSGYFAQLTRQIKQIADYLCDKEETVFRRLYDRKITKAILAINQVKSFLMIGTKINHKLLLMATSQPVAQTQNRQSTPAKSHKSFPIAQTITKQPQSNTNVQIDNFFDQLATTEKQTLQFIKTLSNSKKKPNNKYSNQHQIIQSSFARIFRSFQNLQLLFSSLFLQENFSSTIITKPRLTAQVKNHLIQTETRLIDGFKKFTNTHGIKPFLNFIPQDSHASEQDDKLSVISGVSVSSQASMFVPRKIQVSDVILSPPVLSNESLSSIPPLSVDELITACNQFISQSFISNQSLTNELEDLNNINYPQLLKFIKQIEDQSESLIKFNLKPVEQQSMSKTQPKSSGKKGPPEKEQKSQSPKKDKEKGRAEKQKSPTKSSKSPVANKSGKKVQQAQQKISNPIQTQQALKRQALSLMKSKLQFIKEILLPEISQCRVSRIFEQNFQAQIFQQLAYTLNQYKLKISSEKVSVQAKKYGFEKVVQNRVKFMNTITKDMKELGEVFSFVRVFSEQKLRLESIEQQTYNLALRALLAQKQIQAYRRENSDLAKANKLSQGGVKWLQNQIYTPFLHMFKHLLKMVSTDDMVVKELEGMLQSVRASIELKQRIMKLVDEVIGENILLPQIKNKIQDIGNRYSVIKTYPILKFKKLQSIVRRLRYCLTLKPKNRNQEKMKLIKNYLKDKFQLQEQTFSL